MKAIDVLFLQDDELIFVVMDTENGGKVAVEANHQLVVFAESMRALHQQVQQKVQEHYHGNFTGTIRLREFRDTLIDTEKLPLGQG